MEQNNRMINFVMKKMCRNILATLMAIVLSVTFTVSDYATVDADTTTLAEVSSEKELVQCSNDWVIFKYTDENGEPTFDVKYQGKSSAELKQEGYELQYRIFSKDYDMPIYVGRWKSTESRIELGIPKEKCKVQFNLINASDSSQISMSDSFALENDDNLLTYILYASSDYYYNLTEKPNSFKLDIKVNQHLQEIGNLSVSVEVNNFGITENYILDDIVSNLSFKNASDNYTVGEKNYTLDYSIISFDVELPPTINVSGTDVGYLYTIDYTFSFNNLVGLYNNSTVEDFILTVITPDPYYTKPILVQSIQLTAPSSNIKTGDSINLTANILPSDATRKTLYWSSSNTNYATVDENGVVTAKAAGAGKSVTITAEAVDGSRVEGTYVLNIEEIPTTPVEPPTTAKPKDVLVNSIKITSSSTKVNAGKTIDLNASVNSNATNKSIVWSSSNTKYATVNSNGLVTTKKAGAGKTVVITAKAADGSGKKATIKIKINKVKVKKLKLKVSKKSVKVGKKLSIKVSITPTDATNQKIKWSVSNKKYAKINSKGVLTAKKAGAGKTVKVTAKAKDGSGKKATIKIKIKK